MIENLKRLTENKTDFYINMSSGEHHHIEHIDTKISFDTDKNQIFINKNYNNYIICVDKIESIKY